MKNNSNLSRRGVTRRIIVMTCAIMVIFAFMCGRLAYLQLVDYEGYRSNALSQYSTTMILPASRGSITDRNGKIIAMSETVETVFISPKGIEKGYKAQEDAPEKDKVDYRKLISENLSELLSVDRSDILARMDKTNSQYEVIKRNVAGETAEKVRQFIIDNNLYTMVNMEEASKRYYPYGTLASHLVGFNGTDGGLMGLERFYEDELAGIDGRIVKAKNGTGNDLTFKYETYIEAQNGSNVVTTIDVNIQSILEKYIEKAYNDHNPQNKVAGIIMNVDTGEIYASAVYPDFDLNDPYTLTQEYQEELNKYISGDLGESKSDSSTTSTDAFVGPLTEEDIKKKENELRNEMWNNKVANDTYEPGSTFKIVTSAIALEDGVSSIGDSYHCDGEYTLYGTPIHCHKAGGHGNQTFAECLQNSCNPAFVDLGLKIGEKRFIKYFEEFGFLELSGSDMLGERKTYYYGTNGSPFTEFELATYSFGQSFRTTMLQELRAVSTVANGGYLVTPHVAKYLTDDNGNVTYTFDYSANKKQIISKANSDTIVKILAEGINIGSTKNAAVAGYTIAAKTGTSQKLERVDEDVYVSSCVAFAPAEDPQIAIIIAVDEPTAGEFYGGLVAAPVVSNVLSEVLPYLEIPMNGENEHPTINITKYVDKTVENATKLIEDAGLEYVIIGEGDTVVEQIPASGSSVTDKGTVYLFTEYESEHEKTKIPEVKGYNDVNALRRLYNAGLNVRIMGAYSDAITGTPMVKSISIEEGTEVDKGTLVVIEFRYYDEVYG